WIPSPPSPGRAWSSPSRRCPPPAGGRWLRLAASTPSPCSRILTALPKIPGRSYPNGTGVLRLACWPGSITPPRRPRRRHRPARRPDLAARRGLGAGLGGLARPWGGGPYSEPARQLVARHASCLGRALARFDELARQAARSGPPVITHGEPHPGNILRSAGRLYLIDWNTVGLALPERDLWDVVDADSHEADRYAELTGRRVSAAAMRMYRMRWSLDEITLSLSEFRGPHEQNADTELTWAVLAEETENVLQLAP